MDKYYINSKTGEIEFNVSEEQIENESQQILFIKGTQSLGKPEIWLGEYNGELVFHSSMFENKNGSENLNIKVNNVIIQEIKNVSYRKYIFKYEFKNEIKNMEVDDAEFNESIKKLSEL